MSTNTLNIGLDLDEVLIDIIPSLLVFYERLSGRRVPLQDIKSYNLWENGVGRTREEAVELFAQFFQSKEFDGLPVAEGAREAVERFAQEGKVYVITSRPEELKEKTETWIGKRGLAINGGVIYTGDFHRGAKTKAEVCRELRIGEFYEDSLKYASECARYVQKVFLFDKPWNQAEVNGNITRVKGWEEVLKMRVGK